MSSDGNGNGDGERPSVSRSERTFEQMTRKHLAALGRTAFRMTGCQEAARDITQETCLKAYRSMHTYKPDTNYRAWIFRILTNLCRDHLRREARAPFKTWDNEEINTALANSSDGRQQPDSVLQDSRFLEDAIEAMAKLPPDIRIVVCFSLLDGFSYQEIADIVEIPVGTVRSRLSRGRKQLQDILRAHVIDKSAEVIVEKRRGTVHAINGGALMMASTRKVEKC